MVLSCKVLLDKNPKPTRPEIRAALAGNLCRCGTYPHVLDAVESVAGLKVADEEAVPLYAASRPPTAGPPRLLDDLRVDSATAEALEAEEA